VLAAQWTASRGSAFRAFLDLQMANEAVSSAYSRLITSANGVNDGLRHLTYAKHVSLNHQVVVLILLRTFNENKLVKVSVCWAADSKLTTELVLRIKPFSQPNSAQSPPSLQGTLSKPLRRPSEKCLTTRRSVSAATEPLPPPSTVYTPSTLERSS
jgi:hypothetical protein